MTTHREPGRERNFISAVLPWLAAVAAFTVYLLTLNRWVSLNPIGLGFIAKAAGQTWTPDVHYPVFSLVTYPFQWLPLRWLPVLLNIFSAVCAALTLGLLARSVSLLPHDRTNAQRQREQDAHSLLSLRAAWIPPALAVAVCGLQLSFWENATNISAEMFDLLLFAYAIRCLLEFRIAQRDSWLLRAAFVYAAGMTDSWVFVALAPAFLGAVLWMKGLKFFHLAFLGRWFLFGFLGLLFYLALPLMHLISEGSFWPVLKTNWFVQKSWIVGVFQQLPGHMQLLMVMTSVLPVLFIGIRWKSSFGDPSHLGVLLTTWIMHLAHAFFLGLCVWTAFDPAFSLRNKGLGALPLYYLGALSVGYFAGYFLLVFIPLTARGRRTPAGQKFLYRASTATVYLLLALAPLGLIYKNIPSLKVTNGPGLKQYAASVAQSLPDNCVVLSDHADRLLLTSAYTARNGKAGKHIFLETHALKNPEYQRQMQKRYPQIWPIVVAPERDKPLEDLVLLNFMARLSESNALYYLHPSFGYYFEYFYAQPHGVVYELKRYPTNTMITPPAWSQAELQENETFWEKATAEMLQPLVPFITQPPDEATPSLRQRFLDRLRIRYEANAVAVALGRIYSLSLNHWGVEAQQAKLLESAGKHFATAAELNPNNVVARVNLEYNENLRAGRPKPLPFSEQRYGRYRTWEDLMNENGLFDEPNSCLLQGRIFMRGRLFRQSAAQFSRVLELAPENLPARLALASLYLVSQTPEKALPLLDYLNAHSNALVAAEISPLEVLQTDLAARFVNQQDEHAERIIRSILARTPPDTNAMNTLVQVCSAAGRHSNALQVVEKQLQLQPKDHAALINKGFLNIQLGNFDAALPPLNTVLAESPTNYFALLNRAIAYLRGDNLEEAKKDYDTLQTMYPKAFAAYYGLGEIALRNQETNSAIQYFELFLAHSPPNNPENNLVRERLQNLRPAPR